VTIGWKSRWFAPKSNFGEFLVEDEQIRRYIDKRLNRKEKFAAISSTEIERTREEVKVVLKTARPGLVIGPKGADVDALKNDLEDLTDRRVNISIVEIKNPDLEATLVAEGISEQLKRRASFRRTIKQRAESAMQAGAKGVKIMVSGRLGGADMSRSETQILGSIPLQTLEADVDYGFVPCFTTYGTIGVKVWVYRGMFGDQVSSEEAGPAEIGMTRARRRRERGGGGGGGRGPGRGRRRDEPSAPTQPRPGGSRLGALRARQAAEAEQAKQAEQAASSGSQGDSSSPAPEVGGSEGPQQGGAPESGGEQAQE
jgi:small subunit ribosomal protein S3